MHCCVNTADLAVDWINDKLYVADSAGPIIEYDLVTKATRVVVNTGANPTGIVVYPYPNYG